jgi:hypothetical protein
MTFEHIQSDTHCDCISGASEDIICIYVRKIQKPISRDKDWLSYWEVGKRPIVDDCSVVCSFKGLSVNLWSELSKRNTLDKFLTTFKFSHSNKKNSLLVFKIKPGAGLVKHTPEVNDPYHYDFYKCDNFTEDMFEHLEVIELINVLKQSQDEAH